MIKHAYLHCARAAEAASRCIPSQSLPARAVDPPPVQAATDERDQKEELKAQRTEDSAASKGDSGETTATKEADEKSAVATRNESETDWS